MIASVPQADPPKLGRRIVRLFRPHRGALALIVAMILITSALSVISALLVRRVFDHALFVRGGPDLGVLYPLVAAVIAIPIVNGVLNVAQTYLTEVVGNRVLEELRPDIFAKGGDYGSATLPETAVLAQWGGQAVIVPYLEGRSTTRLVEEVRRARG